jgi:DNA end-binding protein Ku
VYALLARAMEESELVAVATFVMREREHLACLRVRDRVITLERMHFADEIRPSKDLAPKGVRVAKEELEMAARLVDQYTGKFRPESFKDTYRNTLRKIIRAKDRGEAVPVAEPEEPEAPVDPWLRSARASSRRRNAAEAESARGRGARRRPEAARAGGSPPCRPLLPKPHRAHRPRRLALDHLRHAHLAHRNDAPSHDPSSALTGP